MHSLWYRKEKQAEDEKLGGNYNFSKIGIKDGVPATEHIITAINKMKQMKIDLTKNLTVRENRDFPKSLNRERENNDIL